MKKIKNASDKAIEIINQNNIKPIPKWELGLKNGALWMGIVVTILTGGIAMAVVMYMIESNDWDLYYFPYFWLVILLVLITGTLISYRKTKRGYRTELVKLIVVIVGLSGMAGVAFAKTGMGKKIDSMIAKDIPVYRQLAPMKYQMWMRPEEGYLTGEIEKKADSQLQIRDLEGKTWKIQLDETTNVRGRVGLVVGELIKIEGEKTKSNEFKADEIRPWNNRFGN